MVTVYEKMGHPANLFKMPFFVPLDSAFFALHFDIFFPFCTKKRCCATTPRTQRPASVNIRGTQRGNLCVYVLRLRVVRFPGKSRPGTRTRIHGHGSCACREGTVGRTVGSLPSLRSVQREREC